MNTKYLTIREVANQLKITNSVVNEMIRTNVFEVTKIKGSQKIEKSQVDEWLANLNEREIEQLALNRSVCRFSDYFDVKNVLLDCFVAHIYFACFAYFYWYSVSRYKKFQNGKSPRQDCAIVDYGHCFWCVRVYYRGFTLEFTLSY